MSIRKETEKKLTTGSARKKPCAVRLSSSTRYRYRTVSTVPCPTHTYRISPFSSVTGACSYGPGLAEAPNGTGLLYVRYVPQPTELHACTKVQSQRATSQQTQRRPTGAAAGFEAGEMRTAKQCQGRSKKLSKYLILFYFILTLIWLVSHAEVLDISLVFSEDL